MVVRSPAEWGSDQVVNAIDAVGAVVGAIHRPEKSLRAPRPAVARIGMDDIKESLRRGFEDFTVYRTDVIVLCALYPAIGLILSRWVVGEGRFEAMFPIASGFALIGPFIALGLYEMSRRREHGETVSWATAFEVLRSRSAGAIAVLGLLLLAIFIAWLSTAQAIYTATMGPDHPASLASFAHDLFATGRGWALIGWGVAAGFLFAAVVFAISVVSFPLLLDRDDLGADLAIATSIRAVAKNPGPMAAWAATVVAGLVLGSIPAFVGLALTIPVLGHATWHLYRRLVPGTTP